MELLASAVLWIARNCLGSPVIPTTQDLFLARLSSNVATSRASLNGIAGMRSNSIVGDSWPAPILSESGALLVF